MNVIGDVKGKTCLIIDDIIDTAGTLVKTVDASTTPARLPSTPRQPRRALGPAIDRIANSRLQQVVVTNTIPCAKPPQVAKDQSALHRRPAGAAIESITWKPA